MIKVSDYRKKLLEAKREYKARNYVKSCEIYDELYNMIPFDNSSKYSYAWAIYQSRVKNYTSEEQLLNDADLITDLTRQNNLNRTQLCVYTMSVFKVLKLLYYSGEYESLPYWLDKINPDLLDEVRFTKDGEIYPSNKENYYTYSSVTYFKLNEYEKCVNISVKALNSLSKFTSDNGIWFEWRIAKSLRQIGEYSKALEYLNRIDLDKWYVYHEIAENYYFLEMKKDSLKFALKSALKDGPQDMKYNLYTLLYDLLREDYTDYADKHEKLCELIRLEDNTGKKELENEVVEIWVKLEKEVI